MSVSARTARRSAPRQRLIFCCECQAEVQAYLTSGSDVYPRRPDLASLPFWRCPHCRNWVGCHHKTDHRTNPLGVIPGPAMKRARSEIHTLLDPIWQSGQLSRKHLYARLTTVLGRQYHTGELRTLEETQGICQAILEIRASLSAVPPAAGELA